MFCNWTSTCLFRCFSRLSSWPTIILIYINDFSNCSEILDLHLFADDAILFYKHKNLKVLDSKVNNELVNIHIWLSAKKLNLILISQTLSFFTLHKESYPLMSLSLNGINYNQEYSINI